MYFNPWIDRLNRCRPQVKESRRGRSDQHDLAFQFVELGTLVDDIDSRYIFEALAFATALAAIGNQGRDQFVEAPCRFGVCVGGKYSRTMIA